MVTAAPGTSNGYRLPEERFVDPAIAGERYRIAREEYFAAYARSTIRRVSPLAVDALAEAGFSVDQVVSRFVPPMRWPEVPLPVHDAFRRAGFNFLDRTLHSERAIERRFEQRHLAGAGCVLRRIGDARGALGVRMCGDGIEVAILSFGHLITTSAGKGRLEIIDRIPLTLGAAILGRPVGDLAGHPLLRGRGYPVRRVIQPTGNGPTLIEFHTGLLPFGPDDSVGSP